MTQLYFDSRDNHQKLYSYGTTSVTVGSFVFGHTETVTHGLGYKPNVRLYYEPNTDDVWPMTEKPWFPAKPDNIFCSGYTSNTVLTMQFDCLSGSSETFPVHYRIYEEGETGVNTVFDSNKKIEKILSVIEGSFSIDVASVPGFTPSKATETIAHGLGEKCLPVLRWSIDGGTTWVDQGSEVWDGSGTNSNAVDAIGHCDPTNAYIEAQNYQSSSHTITYQLYLFKLAEDNIILDSRKKTFINFDEGSTSNTLSGTVANNATKKVTSTITHDANSSLGSIHISRSDVANREYTFPMKPTDSQVSTSGGNISVVHRFKHSTNQLTVETEVFNASGGSVTITETTFTYRYALFRA